MKIFSLFNIKGGVGKTASAVNLAYLSARQGFPTLLWDLDPQGAASFTYRVQPKSQRSCRKLVRGKANLDDLVRGSDFPNLDLLPADASCFELGEDLRNGNLPRILAPAYGEFQHVFLDCAPNLTAMFEGILSITDVLLCPTIPTTLSLRTLAQLMKHLKKREHARPLVMPFFCMVDRRKSLHRGVCQWVRDQELGFMETSIPYSSLVEQMAVRRNPLPSYSPKSPAALAYEALWQEIQQRIESEGTEGRPLYTKTARKTIEDAVRSRFPGSRRKKSVPDGRNG